jgi:16S rRNA (guanine527-N7)-methyltransferase
VFHVKHVTEAYPEAEAGLRRYASWLSGAGVERGLIGPRETDRIWDRHIANCAALAELIPPNASVIDIGSGAGLPGLVLALVRPDISVTLIEPLARRCDFLNEVVADLGLTVTVVRGRAEQVSVFPATVVTARAVAPLAKLLGWALPLVAPGGVVLAMKGSSAEQEIADAQGILRGRTATVVTCGHGYTEPATTVVSVHS